MNGAVNWAIAGGPVPLPVHAILGIVQALGALGLLALALVARTRGWAVVWTIGLLGILLAAFSGANFVAYGNDADSLLMAIGFVPALAGYGAGAAILRPQNDPQ
jgi:hypothetical protein